MSDTLKVWGIIGVYDPDDEYNYDYEVWPIESAGVFMSEDRAREKAEEMTKTSKNVHTTYRVTNAMNVYA